MQFSLSDTYSTEILVFWYQLSYPSQRNPLGRGFKRDWCG